MRWKYINQVRIHYSHIFFRFLLNRYFGLVDTRAVHGVIILQLRHNEREGVSYHRRLDCLRNRLFRRRSKKTSKLRVTGLCEGNPPVTGGFPSQRAGNAENVSIWSRHHVFLMFDNVHTGCGPYCGYSLIWKVWPCRGKHDHGYSTDG